MKIAYITYSGDLKYSKANNFNENEDLLPYLKNKGIDVNSEIWDDPTVDWSKYKVALLKTPWDYHQKFEKFKQWLDHLEALNIKLLNSYHLVRWNMDKHYLQDIEQSGFNIIPSVFIPQYWKEKIDPVFDQLNTEKLIIKPCVSGGSRNTMVLEKHKVAHDYEKVIELFKEGDFIIQPMMPQIHDGEWSFIFLDGKYSHTIKKKPKKGDFRVQQIFGGTIEVIFPDQMYIDEAEKIISEFAENTLYARVDGLLVDGHFMLMELELVEPFLYLSYHLNAVEKYYQALISKLNDFT
ncbi:hypothetical protein LPB85_13175 [Chryseobacterium sp. LC2016-27]|uniref:ATP-grasp domain-containing protein n=1 Tax=Chryseobacterium sp. LC2016-27 TaxID=2897326 RepID=UPI001E4A75E5|nr:hypothetical protein [Chryseobacterium sp. LC2016-27]MCD0456391.1 hypothetical protein [Chryseobacterium sp. LC2016-27]